MFTGGGVVYTQMLKARAPALIFIFPSLAREDGGIDTVIFILYSMYVDGLVHTGKKSALMGTNIKRDLIIFEGHDWS